MVDCSLNIHATLIKSVPSAQSLFEKGGLLSGTGKASCNVCRREAKNASLRIFFLKQERFGQLRVLTNVYRSSLLHKVYC
jgi:hypothetical protein